MFFIAYNAGFESASTTINGGQSLATGAKVTLQLGVPSGGEIEVVEYGVSMDGSSAATPATFALRATSTATTLGTAHSTSTVKPFDNPIGANSRLTMATTATAYGAATPASSATARIFDRQYIAPTSQFVKVLPEGRFFRVGNTGAAEYLQVILNTSATVNCLAYVIWREII